MSDLEKTKKTPALNVFTKITALDGTTHIGAKIGVAWAHTKNGDGYNIVLDAQPIVSQFTGQIEMIAFPPKTS